jgi:hypothetical protein
VRAGIERACGARVVDAVTASGGFSPGLAARIVCADGRRWFVKAASGQVNPDTPRLHRQEARILGDLDPLIRSGRLPAPRLRATVEHGSWFALILDDIDGRHPALPWEDGQVGQVLGALDRLADVRWARRGSPTPSAPRTDRPGRIWSFREHSGHRPCHLGASLDMRPPSAAATWHGGSGYRQGKRTNDPVAVSSRSGSTVMASLWPERR